MPLNSAIFLELSLEAREHQLKKHIDNGHENVQWPMAVATRGRVPLQQPLAGSQQYALWQGTIRSLGTERPCTSTVATYLY